MRALSINDSNDDNAIDDIHDDHSDSNSDDVDHHMLKALISFVFIDAI